MTPGERRNPKVLNGSRRLRIARGVGHVDRRRFLFLVLDFRLGQRRTAVEAPVDRLQPLEDKATLNHLGQRADFTGLVGEVHGLVGVVPVTQNAETNEVGLLPFDLLGGVGAATLAGQIRWLVLFGPKMPESSHIASAADAVPGREKFANKHTAIAGKNRLISLITFLLLQAHLGCTRAPRAPRPRRA